MVRSVRSPQMYAAAASGSPSILTVPNSKYTQGPPMRRHSEQLQSVTTAGVDGSVIRIAAQWHEPLCVTSPPGRHDYVRVSRTIGEALAFDWQHSDTVLVRELALAHGIL